MKIWKLGQVGSSHDSDVSGVVVTGGMDWIVVVIMDSKVAVLLPTFVVASSVVSFPKHLMF